MEDSDSPLHFDSHSSTRAATADARLPDVPPDPETPLQSTSEGSFAVSNILAPPPPPGPLSLGHALFEYALFCMNSGGEDEGGEEGAARIEKRMGCEDLRAGLSG